MFTGILLALLSAVIVAMIIITLDAILECFEAIREDNGETAVLADAQDLISIAIDDAITKTDKIALSELKNKVGKAGMIVGPVENGKVVKDKLKILNSDRRDQQVQTLLDENGGTLLADLVH